MDHIRGLCFLQDEEICLILQTACYMNPLIVIPKNGCCVDRLWLVLVRIVNPHAAICILLISHDL
jgi:hypothetical protein